MYGQKQSERRGLGVGDEREEEEGDHVARIRLWNQVSDFGLLSQGQEKPVKGFEQI